MGRQPRLEKGSIGNAYATYASPTPLGMEGEEYGMKEEDPS